MLCKTTCFILGMFLLSFRDFVDATEDVAELVVKECKATQYCPDGHTCCRNPFGAGYGCCNLPNAVCCANGPHCCPEGYTCVGDLCFKGDDVIEAVNKIPDANCYDRYSWCPDYTRGCSMEFFQRYCTKSCKKCADIGKWHPWKTWGCNGGTEIRTRHCIIKDCEGPWEQERPCYDGVLTEWSIWSECPVSCGGGHEERTRVCQRGVCDPSSKLFDSRYCNTPSCGVLTEWSIWSECPVTCGSGHQERTRVCLHGVCDPLARLLDGRYCNISPCKVLTEWSIWSECPVTCGSGHQERTRVCLHGVCDPLDWLLDGRNCNTSPCEVLTEWSIWSVCPVICGGGHQERTRVCLHGVCDPSLKLSDDRYCNTSPCEGIDCTWSSWTGAKCVKHGEGDYRVLKTRQKKEAKNGGKECEGSSKKEIACETPELIATTFLKSVTQSMRVQFRNPPSVSGSKTIGSKSPPAPTPSRANPTQSSASQPAADPESPADPTSASPETTTPTSDEDQCSRQHVDDQGTVTMVGNRCGAEVSKVNSKHQWTVSATKSPPPLTHRDILFLVDESGSVGEGNFKLGMSLAQTMALKFCGNISIDEHGTHVGVATFDEEVHLKIAFSAHSESWSLVEEMKKIVYNRTTQGSTCLTEALNFAQKKLFDFDFGFGARVNVDRVIILITDGCANCNTEDLGSLQYVADALRESGITVFSFLINSSEDCLKKIQPLAGGTQCYQIYAESWEGLERTIQSIKENPCLWTWETAGLTEEACPDD